MRYSQLAHYIQLLAWSAESSAQPLAHETDALHEALAQHTAAEAQARAVGHQAFGCEFELGPGFHQLPPN